MQCKREAPGVTAHATGALETFDLGFKSSSFASNPTHVQPERQEITCHRCRNVGQREGSHSAQITRPNGQVERLYLCAGCVSHFQEDEYGRA
jgi:hypothetical protein